MVECKHEPGWDLIVVKDDQFANIDHYIYQCKKCGASIEMGFEVRDGKTYRVWRLAEIAGAA